MAKTTKADEVVEVTNTEPPVVDSREMVSMMTFEDRIVAVQNEISVLKNHFNEHGKYYYRKGEDIYAAAKPLCKQYGLLLTVSDHVEAIGDRHYIIATATIFDSLPPKDGQLPMSVSVTAYAREESERKGMTAAQLSGATSSYARKYALNGLFGLDDVADDDVTNTHGKDDPHAVRVIDGPQPGGFGATAPKPKTQITFGGKRDGAGF